MHGLLVFFFGFFLGGIIEYLLTFLLEVLEKKPIRINHRFTVGKKVSLISLPIWGVLALLFTRDGMSYVALFAVSALVGTILEGVLGAFLRKVFSVKIWTYKKGSLGNFTSLYAIPYWGAAGLVFAFLGKLLGL